ncbi:MAG: NAD(P)H-dependent oxidoreductase [Hyphomonadaceae bacterium]|nr:NAD(P)H-dependent oxidoreductase [Hyphomonadaceae bacterium]
MFKILGVSGSLRAASHTTAVLRTLIEAAPAALAVSMHSLADLPLFNADLDPLPAPVQAFKEAVKGADGLLVATPEYNYGMPGLLKNAIDWASRPGFASVLLGKPALIVSQSPGAIGGARAHAQVREALSACGCRVLPFRQITIGNAGAKVADGRLVDKDTIAFALAGLEELRKEILRARAPIS